MQLRMSNPAISDIEEIADYLAEKASMNSADKFLAALNKKLKKISQFPSIGRLRSEIRENARSISVESYLVLYEIDDNIIVILRVVSGYQDLTALFDD